MCRFTPVFCLALRVLSFVWLLESCSLGQVDSPKSVSFKISKRGDPILLPVQMGNEQFDFVLDTGASVHVFDTSLEHYLGDPLSTRRANTASSPIAMKMFRLPKATVGGVRLDSTDHVGSFDFTEIRQVFGEDVRGVIGIDFFRNRIVQFDFDAGVLHVLPRQKPLAAWGPPISLVPGNIPRIDAVRIAGVEGSLFLVDTGSTGTITFAGFLFRFAAQTGSVQTTGNIMSVSASGVIPQRRGRVSEFTCGSITATDVTVEEGRQSSLGLGYLSRYCVTLDVSGGNMYLRPGSRANEPYRENLSGLHLKKVDGRIVVFHVDSNSSSDNAGVEAGDVILVVNKTSTSQLTLSAIRRHFKQESGTVVSLALRRRDRKLHVTFELREG